MGVTSYIMNGLNIKNATNITTNASVGSVFKYPVTNGSQVFVIAFPSNISENQSNSFVFNYSLVSDLYSPNGLSWQEQMAISNQTSYLSQLYDTAK